MKVNKTQGGRPHSVDSKICLATVSSWTRTQGASWVQSIMFGISSSTLSDWLRFGLCCLNLVLYDHEDARIAMGPDVKIEMWKEAIAAKYPDLDGVYLAVDGLKLLLQQPGDDRIQNYFTMGGPMTTTLVICLHMLLMGQLLHLSLMLLDHFMTAQLQTLVDYTPSSLVSLTTIEVK